ncbi:MAG TPA: M12 family metallo-peptidase [Thermoanaerobaculia bacterium]|nr:M12 family metallo-peptidase [Thermoanaerobaculia bacterium]
MFRHSFRLFALTIAFTATATAALAAPARGFDSAALRRLEGPLAENGRVRIENVPLVDDRLETLVLERFDVLAPNATIEVFDREGKATRVEPQAMRQFRGHVEGDPASVVFITMGKEVGGLIVTREHKFTLSSAKAVRGAVRAERANEETSEHSDVAIEEVPLEDDFAVGTGFVCGVEGAPVHALKGMVPQSLAMNVAADAYTWPTASAVTVLNMAIESDSALYANFGNNAASVETFLRNLLAAASTIYHRDLRTDLRISYLGIRTNSDPWSVNPGQTGSWNGKTVGYSTTHALLEYGDYWHNTPPTTNKRSAAMLVSGQSQLAGVAWIETACDTEFYANAAQGYPDPYAGHYGGPFAYCGGVGVYSSERVVPDPNALANFATPSNYWPLMEVAHELGHNVQSDHTHCTQLSVADQATYGRQFVDSCNASQGGCYSGVTSLPLDGAGGRGTIMSYCHLIAGASGSRFTFGQPGEASHLITDLMRAHLDAVTPTGLSAITAPTTLATGANGNASVTNNGALNYAWSITNGTINSGANTASINFTATANPVTLTVVATNTNTGCGVSDSKTVSVTSATAPAAPANLVATTNGATSIVVAWSSVSGATSYELYRSTGGAYSYLATTTNPLYTDNAAATNTAYRYYARALNGTTPGPFSPSDFAVAIAFTDASLVNVHAKAQHINELRTGANALRALAGLGAYSFTGTITSGTQITTTHITQLRTAIDQARTAIGGVGLVGYETLTAGSTKIKAQHILDLRVGLQ